LMGVEKGVVIERVELGQDDVEGGEVVTVHVRVARRGRGRCGVCQRRCPGYDSGHGRRRWC
jgi:transposase